ncbi:MAG: hypothetical protein HY436_00270 [Candidatus Liptonbacteria bacterium]|nr:hypothetical protein [Candidatus Liptonbacteria bacterium]
MHTKRVFPLFAVLIALALAAFFGIQTREARRELHAAEAKLAGETVNRKILGFGRLFVDKVLNAEGEVSFEDRLALENAVRDIKDDAVLARWQAFIASRTEREAQEGVKRLLEALFVGIKAE